MLDKHRVVAITKCDTVDNETIELIKPHVNLDVPVVYISSVAHKGMDVLKDILGRRYFRRGRRRIHRLI